MNQYVPNVGFLCDEEARRDAFHEPVTPVEAGEDLKPSDPVEVIDGKIAVKCEWEKADGIVDPLLPKNGIKKVKKGQKFWIWIFPGTIEGLRHAWMHRKFRAKVPELKPEGVNSNVG